MILDSDFIDIFYLHFFLLFYPNPILCPLIVAFYFASFSTNQPNKTRNYNISSTLLLPFCCVVSFDILADVSLFTSNTSDVWRITPVQLGSWVLGSWVLHLQNQTSF